MTMAHLKSVLTFSPASPEERAAEMLGKQYTAVRQQTVALAASLSAEDQMIQSCPEASPVKWHQAHTSWFFETFILSAHLPDYRPFNPKFRDLFNSYYNAVGQQPDKAIRLAYHPSTAPAPASGAVPQQKPQLYPEGLYEIGANAGTFHFDNEASRHKVFVRPFRFGMRLATCGEYVSFMEDRGYARPELWLSEGWKTVQAHHWIAPLYWEKIDGQWHQFTCSGMKKVEDAEPVCHISYYEPAPFPRWPAPPLPTEFEWEVAAPKLTVQGNLRD